MQQQQRLGAGVDSDPPPCPAPAAAPQTPPAPSCSLFRGLGPLLVRACCLTAAQFTPYDIGKDYLVQVSTLAPTAGVVVDRFRGVWTFLESLV